MAATVQPRRESQMGVSPSCSLQDVALQVPGPQIPSVRYRLGKLTRHLSMKFDALAMAASFCRNLMSGMSIARLFIALLVVAAIVCGLLMLPMERMLKDFLLWLKRVGPWGPFIMAAAYIPLNILALPASILTLGGGYVFGLTVGFAADSIGSTAGATAAFLVGKTLCRGYVSAKLRDYPQFQIIAHAISKSGFKIVLLLRLVPILPFNVMNYALSVTPISVGTYMLASWIGMMPVTFAFVYLGTTIKDISEIGSAEAAFGPRHWWMLGLGLVLTVLSTILITRVARDALEKAIEEHEGSIPEGLQFVLSNSRPNSPLKGLAPPGAVPAPARTPNGTAEGRMYSNAGSESSVCPIDSQDSIKNVFLRVEEHSVSGPTG